MIALILIGAIVGAVYYFRGPIPDNRMQHNFVEAARRGDILAMEKLHSAGAVLDVPASYEHGAVHSAPPIYGAITSEHADAVRWLLNKGANHDVLMATETPLDVAEYYLKKRPNSEALRDIVADLKARGAKRLSEI